jgi:hypothetical protein
MINNTSGSSVEIQSLTLSDSQNFIFSPATNCLPVLTAGNSCLVRITFTPKSFGVKSAVMSVTSDSSSVSYDVQLAGTGDTAVGDSADTPAFSPAALRSVRPGISSGFYWFDPDGSDGNAPFRAYANFSVAGGDWLLVRRIGDTGGFFPGNDNLAGTADVNGGYAAGLPTGGSWSGKFSYFVNGDTEYLFTTGNSSSWCVIKEGGNNFGGVALLDQKNTSVIASSGVAVVAGGTTNVLLRSNPEDPWIGCEGTHSQNSLKMLYGENSIVNYQSFKNSNGGVNIYVRRLKGEALASIAFNEGGATAFGGEKIASAPSSLASAKSALASGSGGVADGRQLEATDARNVAGVVQSYAVERAALSRYELRSSRRVSDAVNVEWWLEYRSFDGGLMGKERLWPTSPVIWRGGRGSRAISSSGWVRQCVGAVWSIQDGYVLLAGEHDLAVNPRGKGEIKIGLDSEIKIISDAQCVGDKIKVSGYLLPINADEPALGLSTIPGRAFSSLIGSGLVISDTKISVARMPIGAICSSPAPELAQFCSDWENSR